MSRGPEALIHVATIASLQLPPPLGYSVIFPLCVQAVDI